MSTQDRKRAIRAHMKAHNVRHAQAVREMREVAGISPGLAISALKFWHVTRTESAIAVATESLRAAVKRLGVTDPEALVSDPAVGMEVLAEEMRRRADVLEAAQPVDPGNPPDVEALTVPDEVLPVSNVVDWWGVSLGPSNLVNIHPQSACAGRACWVHNPSDHHMKEWPKNWRADRRILERVCEHGVGHPDPDDAAYRASVGDEDTVHGCDRCCQHPS